MFYLVVKALEITKFLPVYVNEQSIQQIVVHLELSLRGIHSVRYLKEEHYHVRVASNKYPKGALDGIALNK